MTTKDRELLRADLLRDEGLRLTVYTDTLGVPTIGCGRNLRDKGITATEAAYLLENDIDACLADLRTFPWFSSLDGARHRAVMNLRFQLGSAGFRRFTKMLAALEQGDYAGAADEMAMSRWAEQTPKRAARVIHLMRTGAA